MDLTGKFNPLSKEFCKIITILNPITVKVFIYLSCSKELPGGRQIARDFALDPKVVWRSLQELAYYGFIIPGKKSRYWWNPDRAKWGIGGNTAPPKVPKKYPRKAKSAPPQGADVLPAGEQIEPNLLPAEEQSTAPSLLLKKNIKSFLKKRPEKAPRTLGLLDGRAGAQEKEKTMDENPKQGELPLKTLVRGGKPSFTIPDRKPTPQEIGQQFDQLYKKSEPQAFASTEEAEDFLQRFGGIKK